MTYVLYDTASEKYLTEDWELDGFDKAEHWRKPFQNMLSAAQEFFPNARWVGPCAEDETP